MENYDFISGIVFGIVITLAPSIIVILYLLWVAPVEPKNHGL